MTIIHYGIVKSPSCLQRTIIRERQNWTIGQLDNWTNALLGVFTFLGVSFLILYIYYNIYII